MPETETKSIYARGADCGLWLGLCFIALFLLAAASMRVPALNIAVIATAACVPVLSYRFLRRTHVAAHGLTSFSALWMQGIVMFACGSLLLGAAAYAYIRLVEPRFVAMWCRPASTTTPRPAHRRRWPWPMICAASRNSTAFPAQATLC